MSLKKAKQARLSHLSDKFIFKCKLKKHFALRELSGLNKAINITI